MQVKIVFLSIVFYGLFGFAGSLDELNHFWDKCPQNKEMFYSQLEKYDDQVSDFFSRKKQKELLEIYKRDSKESRLLTLHGPFLLPSGVASFDNTCWSLLQDGIKLGKEKKYKEADEKLISWENCVSSNYKKTFEEAKTIVRCSQ